MEGKSNKKRIDGAFGQETWKEQAMLAKVVIVYPIIFVTAIPDCVSCILYLES